MKILLVLNTHLPVITYGGTERVVWYLGHELQKLGHEVYFLVASCTECSFAKCLIYDEKKHINQQIPEFIDVIHFQNTSMGYTGGKPYIVTYHGNYLKDIDRNAVFVSRNHAMRYNSSSYVYNGLDWDDYGKLNSSELRDYFHFLGKAAWRVKNVRGAIDVINAVPKGRLLVLGGTRLNFKMGFRFTLSPKAVFKGLVGGIEKIDYLQHSRGLIFPVRWDEPFGLAVIESLYCGAPVFATPYGSLPELVPYEMGFLTTSKVEMIKRICNNYNYKPQLCHEYARDLFNSHVMALRYVKKYEIVLNGGFLNDIPPYASFDESRKNYPFD